MNPVLVSAKHEPEANQNLPSVPNLSSPPPPLPYSPNIWIFSESERTCNYMRDQLYSRDMNFAASYTVADMSSNLSKILTRLRDDHPDLIWISSLLYTMTTNVRLENQLKSQLVC